MISNSFHTLPHCATEWWYCTTQYHTVPHSTTQCHTVPFQMPNSKFPIFSAFSIFTARHPTFALLQNFQEENSKNTYTHMLSAQDTHQQIKTCWNHTKCAILSFAQIKLKPENTLGCLYWYQRIIVQQCNVLGSPNLFQMFSIWVKYRFVFGWLCFKWSTSTPLACYQAIIITIIIDFIIIVSFIDMTSGHHIILHTTCLPGKR